jgi:hypothetical protein
MAKVPVEYMKAAPGSKDKSKTFQAFKKLVSNVRRDEHEGLVLPQSTTGTPSSRCSTSSC